MLNEAYEMIIQYNNACPTDRKQISDENHYSKKKLQATICASFTLAPTAYVNSLLAYIYRQW